MLIIQEIESDAEHVSAFNVEKNVHSSYFCHLLGLNTDPFSTEMFSQKLRELRIGDAENSTRVRAQRFDTK